MTGRPVPDLVREIGLPDMVAYAGATWDWHRLHYDQAYVEALGLAAPVVDGQQLGALMAEQAQDHLGPDWFLRSLAYRLKAMVLAGETVTVSAEIDLQRATATLSQRVMVGDRLCAEGTAVLEARARVAG